LNLINLVLLVFAGLFALAAVLSALAGLGTRSRMANSPYGVGRQERRRTMQVSFIRALAFAILALIFFGVYGISSRPGGTRASERGVGATQVPPVASATPGITATATFAATATATLAASTPTATTPSVTGTPTATATATITPTPEPSAIVTAPAGLYLRDVPGGTAELELITEGTVLVLLPGRQTVDDLDWQQVRSPSGLEGWVAAEFLDYQQ
jgi:hypothetical protein